MSLFGSIQTANNALKASQIGLQVVGQNISNVNTPGYIRQELVLTPAPTQRLGGLLLGLGVNVDGVVQKIDQFLVSRLRSAISDRAGAEVQQNAYRELESLLGELTDTDISTAMTRFFGAIHDVLNQPTSLSVRQQAILQGRQLASDIARLSARAFAVRVDLNNQVKQVASDINSLTAEIHKLNIQIAELEGGVSRSDAVGLRDQRGLALQKLAELIDIRVDEQDDGIVSVSINGTFLVTEGARRQVQVTLGSDRGLTVASIELADTQQVLQPFGGKLAGLLAARDEVVGGFLDQLDDFARTLAFEFNKLHSSGQGLTGYQRAVSTAAVDDPARPLDAAGLPFTPVNGAFQILIYNSQTGLTQTTDIRVDLNGLDDDDTTLAKLAALLDAVDGIRARVTETRQLEIVADSPEQDFAFANDTSGILAALGINTFFSGTTARDLGVSAVLLADPSKFAASRGGVGQDTQLAVELAGFLDRPLPEKNGATLAALYDTLVGNVAQGSAAATAIVEGFRVFEESLLGQHLSISGVSLDDEAVRLLSFQRAYQAAAKYIQTLNELLGVLLAL
jgi:flagellar hook-associated protein 1 FlgK